MNSQRVSLQKTTPRLHKYLADAQTFVSFTSQSNDGKFQIVNIDTEGTPAQRVLATAFRGLDRTTTTSIIQAFVFRTSATIALYLQWVSALVGSDVQIKFIEQGNPETPAILDTVPATIPADTTLMDVNLGVVKPGSTYILFVQYTPSRLPVSPNSQALTFFNLTARTAPMVTMSTYVSNLTNLLTAPNVLISTSEYDELIYEFVNYPVVADRLTLLAQGNIVAPGELVLSISPAPGSEAIFSIPPAESFTASNMAISTFFLAAQHAGSFTGIVKISAPNVGTYVTLPIINMGEAFLASLARDTEGSRGQRAMSIGEKD